MKRVIVCVKDVKADFFASLSVMETAQSAIRSFGDYLRDDKSIVAQHPEDFALYQLGEFDVETGRVSGFDTPLHLCNAADLVRKEN